MDKPKKDEPQKPTDPLPALFATIHFKSPARPDGYTAEDIENLNQAANERPKNEGPPGARNSEG